MVCCKEFAEANGDPGMYNFPKSVRKKDSPEIDPDAFDGASNVQTSPISAARAEQPSGPTRGFLLGTNISLTDYFTT